MTDEHRSMIERLLDSNIEALNRQDLQAVLANQHPDARLVADGQVVSEGHDQLARLTQTLWKAFPDGRFRHDRRVITDRTAATELTFTGTQSGPWRRPPVMCRPPDARSPSTRRRSCPSARA